MKTFRNKGQCQDSTFARKNMCAGREREIRCQEEDFRVAEENKNFLHESGGTLSEADVRHPLGESIKNPHAVICVVVGGRHAGN